VRSDGDAGGPASTNATPGLPKPVRHRSPLVIASVGTTSGPIGETLRPAVVAVQVWANLTNARGGLNGRAIKLIVYDDGGDPARHRAQLQDAIEQRKAIAFVQNSESVTGSQSVEYITSKRVPVIGGPGPEPWYYDSPMYFPQQSAGRYFFLAGLSAVGQHAGATGKRKVGWLVCAEVDQVCGAADRFWAEAAAKLGLQVVYRGKASVAQPDFTAECLNARNAGVETFLIGMDTNSLQRIGTSCTRQGYHPQWATLSSIAQDRLKDDPIFDGLIAETNVFPYFQDNTPATAEFRDAIRTAGDGNPPGIGLAVGWVSAKLFEKVAVDLPEPPTSGAILEGLWALRGETLGGLTLPLTFRRDQPAVGQTCWFNLVIKDRRWDTPDDSRMWCV
jgi:branched-chain amino acid transport system substrate-binding protein